MIDYKIRTQRGGGGYLKREMKRKINKETQVRRMYQVKIQMKKRRQRKMKRR